MDDAERQRQRDDAYRAIGRYIVTFSEMFGFMRQTMSERLTRPGGDFALAELALAEYTAYPIMHAFFAMCRTLGNLDATEKRIATWLLKRVGERIEQRNRIAHGDWLLGALTHTTHAQTQHALPVLITTESSAQGAKSRGRASVCLVTTGANRSRRWDACR
jgi:hypothetical protein